MADVFISYAHESGAQARAAADALKAAGYSVWIDDDLPAHRAFTREIERELVAAKAVLAIWSAEAAESDWVLSEANRGREARKLVQLRLDGAGLPMPFDQLQCADLTGWAGEPGHPGWLRVTASIGELVGGAGPASAKPAITPQAKTLPDKPSIAVLPFADPTGAADGDYFADGMADEIATALARFPSLFVIANSSSRSYAARDRDVAQIGRELAVRYLLEGAVRRSGDRVRISVSLVEAADGAQVWAERFDGTFEDIFALQDEVANVVAARVEPSIQAADLRRGAARPTADLTAYELFLRGRQLLLAYDRERWPEAEACFEQAVARDPAYTLAWAYLAWGQTIAPTWGWSAAPDESWRKAKDGIRRALAAGGGDDPRAMPLIALASLYHGGDARASEAMADRALALNPGSAIIWLNGAMVSSLTGQPALALERFQQALRLDPRLPDRFAVTMGVGTALMLLERFDEAVPWLEEAEALRPGVGLVQYLLAATYAELGRLADGAATLAKAQQSLRVSDFIARGDTLPGIGTWTPRIRERLRDLGADV